MQCRLSDIAHTNCLDHCLEIRHFILARCKLLQMSNYQEAECSADLVTSLTLTVLVHYLEIRHFILAGCKLLQMSNYQEAECSADLVTLLTLTAWIIIWKLDFLFWLGVSYFKCPIIRKLNAVQT